MADVYEKILKKAEIIIADSPTYYTEKDKVKILSRRFRLDRNNSKDILKVLRNLKC